MACGTCSVQSHMPALGDSIKRFFLVYEHEHDMQEYEIN